MSSETTIETGVRAMLCTVCDEVATLSGLAVLRGPVGIGKTYALQRIKRQLEEQGVFVVMVTATEATAGNINAFLRSILGQYHTETGSSSDAEEAVWTLLSGNPFMPRGQRVVLIVDEAQKLAGRVLETIRGLWDRGEPAREGDFAGNAFGCVMVGNPTFMGKGGAQRVASFEALISRLSHNLQLPRPSRKECLEFAGTIYSAPELVQELADFGQTKGNLRSMAIASRNAALRAGDDQVTLSILQTVIKMMGGK